MENTFVWFPHWMVYYDEVLDIEKFVRKEVRLDVNSIGTVEEGYVYCEEGEKECLKVFTGDDPLSFYALDVSLTDFKLIEMHLINSVMTSKGILRAYYN